MKGKQMEYEEIGLSEANPRIWTPELQRVYNRYPSASTSRKWPDIIKLANNGEIDSAMDLAKESERTGEVIFANKITRKMRIERAVWFSKVVVGGEKELKVIFNMISKNLSVYIEKNGTKLSNLNKINKRIHEEMVLLRKEMRTWLNKLVRGTARIALQNISTTYKTVFKQTQEGYLDTDIDFNGIEGILDLMEAKAIIHTKKTLSSQASIATSTIKWRNIQKKIIKSVMKKNLMRFKPSEAIWDITQRAESQLKRMVTANVARGIASDTIANKVKKFISPSLDVDPTGQILNPGTGVYKSPFKNAMRIARTETNRAYAKAAGEYAGQKKWIIGKTFHIARPHTKWHNCDEWNGRTVTVEKYNQMVDNWKFPFHPNCVCYTTDKIDEKYLEKEAA